MGEPTLIIVITRFDRQLFTHQCQLRKYQRSLDESKDIPRKSMLDLLSLINRNVLVS